MQWLESRSRLWRFVYGFRLWSRLWRLGSKRSLLWARRFDFVYGNSRVEDPLIIISGSFKIHTTCNIFFHKMVSYILFLGQMHLPQFFIICIDAQCQISKCEVKFLGCKNRNRQDVKNASRMEGKWPICTFYHQHVYGHKKRWFFTTTIRSVGSYFKILFVFPSHRISSHPTPSLLSLSSIPSNQHTHPASSSIIIFFFI